MQQFCCRPCSRKFSGLFPQFLAGLLGRRSCFACRPSLHGFYCLNIDAIKSNHCRASFNLDCRSAHFGQRPFFWVSVSTSLFKKGKKPHMFTRKPKTLPLAQSENYFFVVSSDKISGNNKKIYLLKFLSYLRVSKHPTKNLYGK